MKMIRTAILAAAGILLALPAQASQCPPLRPLGSTSEQVWVLAEVGKVEFSRTEKGEDGSSRTYTQARVAVRQVLKGEVPDTSSLVVRSVYVENLGALSASGHRLERGRALLGGKMVGGALEVGGCSGFNGDSAKHAMKALLAK